MEFIEKLTTKKGTIGENIVKSFLQNKGWITYSPDLKNKAHYFDMLATKDKMEVIAVDVKTKARLNKWNAQGIDLRHYKEYMQFVNTTNIPFFLFFIDDKCGDVHCADLSKLTNFFLIPKKQENQPDIIAFYLKDMKKVFQLNAVQIKELSAFDCRNYSYCPEP
ncbi:MAG: hypothetical protein EBR82_77535 [Caulobacteraceae bacterium]|nr:hypothetical protein [Caulobacteraceae bacterium]